MMLPEFNNYMVFVDEAGDHLLRPHYKDFPLFVLAFCLIERQHYADFIVPQFLRLKLKYFQDCHVIFHERDIRKAKGAFGFLTNAALRRQFFLDLNHFIMQAQFKIIASVIRKDQLSATDAQSHHPYNLGTQFGLERLLLFFDRKSQSLPATVAFEARGKKEDKDLELAFLRLTQRSQFAERLQIKILPKIANCCGLQLADLIARPIGRHVMNPEQPNRAYDIIREKIWLQAGKEEGHDLQIFP